MALYKYSSFYLLKRVGVFHNYPLPISQTLASILSARLSVCRFAQPPDNYIGLCKKDVNIFFCMTVVCGVYPDVCAAETEQRMAESGVVIVDKC